MSRSDLIPYGALLLRIALGSLFLAHGLLKLLVHKPAGTADEIQGYLSGRPFPIGRYTELMSLQAASLTT